MILNGVDIVENKRFRRLQERSSPMIKELFSPEEIAYCQGQKHPEQNFAARYAAKEAVIKACGLPILGVDLSEIVVQHGEGGRPMVVLSSEHVKAAIQEQLGKAEFHISLSLSHETEYSVAIVSIF